MFSSPYAKGKYLPPYDCSRWGGGGGVGIGVSETRGHLSGLSPGKQTCHYTTLYLVIQYLLLLVARQTRIHTFIILERLLGHFWLSVTHLSHGMYRPPRTLTLYMSKCLLSICFIPLCLMESTWKIFFCSCFPLELHLRTVSVDHHMDGLVSLLISLVWAIMSKNVDWPNQHFEPKQEITTDQLPWHDVKCIF